MGKESTYSMLARLNAPAKKSQHQVDFSTNNQEDTSNLSAAVPVPIHEETEKMEQILKNMLGSSHSNKPTKRT